MEITPSELAKALSISAPYASQILKGRRDLSRELAIKLFRKTGEKLGPIAGATDEEIEVLGAFPERSNLGDAKDPAKAA